MKTATQPIAELTATTIALLCREIGPVNTARFINHFSNGFGNYTEERDELLGNPTVENLVKAIEARRSSGRSTKRRRKSAPAIPRQRSRERQRTGNRVAAPLTDGRGSLAMRLFSTVGRGASFAATLSNPHLCRRNRKFGGSAVVEQILA